MNRRTFGERGVRVSEMGLGCWQLGGTDWGEVSEECANSILQAAVDNGVTYFDTADVYGLGRSEKIIGKFIKDCPECVFVATKLGRFPDPGWPCNFSLRFFRSHTEASLRRLGVEAIDLAQLHCLPIDMLKEGSVFDWMRSLRREGKIKRFGASVESVDEALLCLEQDGISSIQIICNVLRQKPVTELFDRAAEVGVAIVVRLPLDSGLLSGKMTKTTQFGTNDHRNYNRDGKVFNVGETFGGLPFGKGVELVDELKALVPGGMTLPQMAIRWLLDFEAVSVVIPGASSAAQAQSNALVSELPPLDHDLHVKLREFYETRVADSIRGPY